VISEPAGTCRYHDKALVFGYGALMAEQLGQGIARLADVLNV